MIAELYANMCGAELWNRARLAQYMANGIKPPGINLRCAPCDNMMDLIPCIEDEPLEQESGLFQGYQLPEIDDAPWYDPLAPESKDFAGMLVLETSLSPAMNRRMVQNVGHGSTLTRTRFAGRTLTVRGLLIGRTCCAVDYGFKWLTQALLGSFCDACDGCTLTYLACSPATIDESACVMVQEESGRRIPYLRPDEDSEWSRGLDFVRQMYGAGLLQGPEITKISGPGNGSCSCSCGTMTEVEFTIGISNPWQYRTEELVVEDIVLAGCDTEDCVITFSDSPDCDPFDLCPKSSGCDDDPNCEEAPVPPPTGRVPLQQCGCIPLVVGRNNFAVPADREWFDQALIIEVSAGSSALRNLTIRAWQNPIGLDCADPANQAYFEECNACATLMVGYVPAGGLLHFDSAARKVTITCNGVTRPAAKNISTIEGLPFEWFEVGCQPVCVGIDIDCLNTASDASVTAYRVGREL